MSDSPPLVVDIAAEHECWRGREEVLARALATAAEAEATSGAVSVLLTGDNKVADLNMQFRGKKGPTNVLSFPPPRGELCEPGFLGDIALAAETVASEAELHGKSFDNHAAHLAVHGFLHLLGYDHMNEADAAVMEAREIAILAKLGIEDPYS